MTKQDRVEKLFGNIPIDLNSRLKSKEVILLLLHFYVFTAWLW